jgi:hypothetical protein
VLLLPLRLPTTPLQLYIAYTSIKNGMTSSGKYSYGTPGHVDMPENSCGAVFQYSIDSTYTANFASVGGPSLLKLGVPSSIVWLL